MTTPATKTNTPTRKNLFEKKELNIEFKTVILLEQYQEYQRKQGRAYETIASRLQALKQVARQIDINNPEAVKLWLADNEQCKWSNKTKTKFVDAYTSFLTFKGETWQRPTYTIQNKLPFIPTEQEIDTLINACGKVTSTALQMLKETAMRVGELAQLKWTDLDKERKTINITPEKGSNPRILPISDKLLGMINSLPKKDRPTIFQPRKNILREYFSLQRKEIAERFNNPRIKQITFHTFRHWKATMEQHETGDVFHVRNMLGHKSLNSTLIYINLSEATFTEANDKFTCKVAHNPQEEAELIEAGFTHVNNRGDLAFYKKRK
jgi:integrase